MKKKFLIPLALLIIAMLVVPAYAALHTLAIHPSISFDGTTAECSVSIAADKPTDSIKATLTLWDGSKRVDSWIASGTGYLLFSDSTQVKKGKDYTLTVDVTIAGTSKPRASITGTCK